MQKDKLKWDKKYQENPELLSKREPSRLLKKYIHYSPNKKALDIACGGGRHTIYLDKLGFWVDSVDISSVALSKLKSKVTNRVSLIEADLDNFNFKTNYYGLIVKTNFLDREVIKKAKEALVKDGIFIVETYVEDKINEKKNSNPDFLLKKDELKDIFKNDFEVLEYIEFQNESYEKFIMKKASIAVRKL